MKLARITNFSLDKKLLCAILHIDSERDRDMMKFAQYETTAIDIKTAYMAINAEVEVDIIENINGEFELWVAKNYMRRFKTFDQAKRLAETMVTVTVAVGG